MLRIGVDTGGTFTDFILIRDGDLIAFKIPSTPKQPEAAVLEGVRKLLRETTAEAEIVHGTTVGTNAILERKGARTALLTTQGFEDILEIGRQNRPGLYKLSASKPRPLVPRELRFGVRERVISTGEAFIELDQDQLVELRERLAMFGVESVAVCYLFAFANPQHEMETAKLLVPLGLPVSLSHEILPEYREYERTSTTVINAYLAPLMAKYIARMGEGLNRLDSSDSQRRRAEQKRPSDRTESSRRILRIMQSNGGSISAQAAAAQPVRTVLSGPAGGVVGAYEVAKLAGFEKIITFDMGGTSTDVSLVSGIVQTNNEARVAELPLGIPVIDIHTVGAGGGSIARIDEGGALRVGPESAGADPGPICYGVGEGVTVTDAHLVLGHLDPDYFLGGQMKLDAARTVHHFAEFCRRFRQGAHHNESPDGSELIEVAQGVIDVANANMARAIKVISVERGYDPRDFALVAFGGAGGLHACNLAEMLSIPQIIVPKNPGLLSALGVLLSDVVKDYSQTVMLKQEAMDAEKLEESFAKLEARGLEDLVAEGFLESRITFSRSLDLRYAGQSFELSIPFPAAADWPSRASERIISEFHRAHEWRYGYADETRKIELVTVRVKARGETEKPQFLRKDLRREEAQAAACVVERPVYFEKLAYETRFYLRDALEPGNIIVGPAVVLEYSATTVIPPDWRGVVDQYENLILARKSA